MSDMDLFDEDGAQAPSITLTQLRKLAERARNLEVDCALVEETLKRQKALLNDLKTKQLPDAMAALGMLSLELADGTEISLNDVVAGSLPKEAEKKVAAINWLINHGGESLIKGKVELLFGKGDDRVAAKLVSELRRKGYEVSFEQTVNHMTLQAFARELLRDGQDVPFDMLGLYAGKTTKFKLPGERR